MCCWLVGLVSLHRLLQANFVATCVCVRAPELQPMCAPELQPLLARACFVALQLLPAAASSNLSPTCDIATCLATCTSLMRWAPNGLALSC